MYHRRFSPTFSSVRVLAMLLLYLSISQQCVHGRKCVCTSKACKEAGMDTCRTRFSCYTEFILTIEAEGKGTKDEGNATTTTRGCTEGATPLLCESGSRPRPRTIQRPSLKEEDSIRMTSWPWPRLRCCDTHDYCNAPSNNTIPDPVLVHETETTTMTIGYENIHNLPDADPSLNHVRSVTPELSVAGGNAPILDSNGQLQHRIKPLHVAALVLAVAALISVFAAYYVITRCTHFQILHPD